MSQQKELYPTFHPQEYLKNWNNLNDEMRERNFIWGSIVENEEYNQYMSPSLYMEKKKDWEEKQRVSKQVFAVYQKTYQLLVEFPWLFEKLHMPKELIPASLTKMNTKHFSYFTRMDMIEQGDTYKVIELNCDTPTGFVESSVANDVICHAHQMQNPNTIPTALVNAWEQIKEDYKITPQDTVFFTSYNEEYAEEDYQTTIYNMEHCCKQRTKFIDIMEIVIKKDGLYTKGGEKINFLYRLYPLEYLPYDADEEENKIGLLFLDHIANGRVHIINPPSAFLMQNKSIMAIMWELLEEESIYYTKEEKEIIRKHIPRTYLSPTYFIENNLSYVSKPVYGRKGGGVSIVINGEIEDEETTHYYVEQPKIYQEYIEMPDQEIGTWDGPYIGKLLWGSYIINGEFAGLFPRVGEIITGSLSMFMGISLEK